MATCLENNVETDVEIIKMHKEAKLTYCVRIGAKFKKCVTRYLCS